MPQIDKTTFFSIIQWSFVIYTGGYLLLNLSNLFTFITSIRLNAKHQRATSLLASQNKGERGALTYFPWVTLPN